MQKKFDDSDNMLSARWKVLAVTIAVLAITRYALQFSRHFA